MFFQTSIPPISVATKGKSMEMGTGEEKSFQNLKHALVKASSLTQPDVSKEFFLECNASDFATGGILSQKSTDGKLHPVAFLSKSLSPPKCKHDIFDKELLAIIQALKAWHH